MQIMLINSGQRRTFFKVRTFLTYASLLLIGIFVLAAAFTKDMFVVYVAYLFVACVGISILITVILMFPRSLGTLFLDSGSIKIIAAQQEIILKEITILLNASEFELSEIKKDDKALKDIPMSGHYLLSAQLPEPFKAELFLTPDDKATLLKLEQPNIILKPQFESRPGLLELPFNVILILGSRFGRR